MAVFDRRDLSEAQAQVEETKALGRKAFAYQCDITDCDQVRDMVAKAAADLGKLDIVIHTAGIAGRGFPIAKTEPKEMRRVLDIHFFGGFYLAKEAIPFMR